MTAVLGALLLFVQLDAAQKALDAKNYPEAIRILNEYTAGHADDYRALFNLAYAYTMNGDRRAAVAAYEKTIGLSPTLFQARVNLATLLCEENRRTEALPHLAAAVEAKPDNLRAVLLYADTLARTGDAARARAQFERAVALDGNSSAGHFGLGKLALEQKDYAAARTELARALELQPGDPSTRLELARVFELEGKPEGAIEIYTQYLKSAPGPESAPVHRRLGAIYAGQQKLEPAAAEFEEAARLAPSSEDDWNLARAYAGLKQPDKAVPHLLRLRQNAPNDYEVVFTLGQMFTLKKDYPNAQNALLEAIRIDPKLPDAYVDLANAFYLQERYPETLQVLDRVAKVDKFKETSWSAFLRAITVDKLGFVQPALDSYKRFLAITPAGRYADQEFQARQRIRVLTKLAEKGVKRRPT